MTSSKAKFLEGRHLLVKNTIKGRMKLYQRLCEISDFLLNKYNPCNFKDGVCDGLNKTSCCIGCKHLIPGEGCSTLALQCKLYLCYDVREGHLHDQLGRLQSIASMNNLIYYREGNEFTENKLSELGLDK